MNLKINILISIILSITISFTGTSQTTDTTTFSLSKAVAIAMNQNQEILMARNNLRIAENNAGILNSGYLPQLTGSAGGNYSNNNTSVTYASGDKVTQDGAVSTSYNGSLGINYRLFDGMNRYYNHKILKADYTYAELQSRAVIENVLILLSRSYYDVARLTSKIENIRRTLAISNTRYGYIKDKYDYGQSTELDLLNSEVDRNNDSVNLINTQRELRIAQNNMNVLLGQQPNINFPVDTLVVFNHVTQLDSLYNEAISNNASYLMSLQNKEISVLSLKQSKSGYLPTLDLNGSYAMSTTDNDVGYLLHSNNKGFSTGLSLSWNIFDSGKTRTRELNAQISNENADFLAEQSRIELNRQFNNAYTNYHDLFFIMQVEKRNMNTNQLNFDRSVEQFRLGQISSLDFRNAQLELQNAIDRYNTAKYNAKVAELELLKLAGLFLEVM
ncbi:MAG: TolC family protein [Bacteroidales bacterium]|nr:TolC family protein [Bacteroidales bacterium]